MNWIKILSINFAVFLALIVFLELFAALSRIAMGKHFIFPYVINASSCEEMKTDVLLTHVPNHLGNCLIKNGYADGEYVRYNESDLSKPVLLTLGGSTTAGFFQDVSSGDTYPNYLSQFLSSEYQILNGGVGAYSSLQELFKVIRDAPRIKNLQTVISLNGINDTPDYRGSNDTRKSEYPFLSSVQVQMNNYQTWIDQRIGIGLHSILPNINSLITIIAARAFNESIIKNLTLSDPVVIDAADRWLINVTRMHAVLRAQGVNYYVFLQPTMGLEGPQSSPKSGSSDEEIFKLLTHSYIQEIRILYAGLKERCLDLVFCFDISDRVPPSGNMYNDPRHHNSEGNRLLARIIADTIQAQNILNSQQRIRN